MIASIGNGIFVRVGVGARKASRRSIAMELRTGMRAFSGGRWRRLPRAVGMSSYYNGSQEREWPGSEQDPNPTWQDITPQRAREVDTPCIGEPCANPEHDHEAGPAPCCNECLSEDVELSDYDWGTIEAGYQDAGQVLHCRNCGHMEQL